MAVLLAWVQVGDPLVLYEGVVPLVLVCAIRVYRRRGSLQENWYELSLAARGDRLGRRRVGSRSS